MSSPGLFVLLIFSYLPLIGLLIAFEDYRDDKGLFGSAWAGLQNFAFLFNSGDAWAITFNTIAYNTAFIVVGLVASVSVALLLYEVRVGWLSGVYKWALFFPYFMAYPIISYIAYAFLANDIGFVNHFLKAIGVAPVLWYNTPEAWPFILVLINLWRTLGYGSIIYLAGIQGISPEYFEAAMIDGARKSQQIWHITLPLLRPLMIILTLLAIGRVFFADFGLFYIVPSNSPLLQPATNVIDVYVYNALTGGGTVGMAAAAGFYQSIVGFALVFSANWIVRRISPEQALF
jgi:putative aldouronate transport system permease protein